ncbi:MAG: hypothetical protein ACT4QA_10140 [Panacagrimonas sp.]
MSLALPAAAQEPVAVATYESIGLYWTAAAPTAANDDDARLEFRKNGATAWQEGLPLWFDRRNGEYRGSLVQLDPGQLYNIRITLDNGISRTLNASTWVDQVPIARTVILPRDSSTPLTITQSGTPGGYVLYTAAPNSTATIDVRKAHDHNIVVQGSYIVIRGLTLRGARRHAINLGGTGSNTGTVNDIVIEKNDISAWGSGTSIIARFGRDLDSAIYANDNSSVSRLSIQRNRLHHPSTDTNNRLETNGTSTVPKGPQAITLQKALGGVVVRYNEIYSDDAHYFNDAMGSTKNFTTAGFPNRDSDIYGNVISHCWDEGIEAEGGNRNIRIWNNYLDKVATPFGLAPVQGGPIYLWKNVSLSTASHPTDTAGGRWLNTQIYNSSSSDIGGRVYLFNNTSLIPRSGQGTGLSAFLDEPAQDNRLRNFRTLNNLMQVKTASTYSIRERYGQNNLFDYDLLNGLRQFLAPQESHGVFGAATLISTWGLNTSTLTGVFALDTGSRGRDVGRTIPNFLTSWSGSGPDIGAHESLTAPMEFGVNARRTAPPPPPPPPTVQAITRTDPSPSNAAMLRFTVGFNQAVTGVDASDFQLASTGLSDSSVATVAGSGASYTVTVNAGTGEGTLGLNLTDNDSITSLSSLLPLGGAGANNGSFATGAVYSVDRIGPTAGLRVASTQDDPTLIAPIHFEVQFSEPTTQFTADDVEVGGSAGASIAMVTGSGSTYGLAISGMSGAGTVVVRLRPAAIQDAVGNDSTASPPATVVFEVPPPPPPPPLPPPPPTSPAPLVLDIGRLDPSPTHLATVQFSVSFDESVTGVDNNDFAIEATGITGARITEVSGSGSGYRVSVATGTGSGNLRLDLRDDDSILSTTTSLPLGGEGSGNGNFTGGTAYDIDRTGPTVTVTLASGQLNPTTIPLIRFSVRFDEGTTSFDADDVELNGNAGATRVEVSGSDDLYVVSVEGMTASGTVLVSVRADAIRDTAGNSSTGSNTASVNFQLVNVETGELRAVPTYESIGLYWTAPAPAPGTDGARLEFRPSNEADWQEGLPLWFDARQFEYRGSLVHLIPGQRYDIRLTLDDGTRRTIQATTWSNGYPIATTVELPANSTEPLVITQSGSADGYVLYTAAPGATATIDVGKRHDHNVVIQGSHVIVRGLTLLGARMHAIRIGNTGVGALSDIVIEHNDVSAWGSASATDPRFGRNLDSAVYAGDNTSVSRISIQRNRLHHPSTTANSWEELNNGKEHPNGPQAISLLNSLGGIVVRYNEIYSDDAHYFNDSMGELGNFSNSGFPNRDSDIYGNYISHCRDDGIESEGGNRNVRIWGNYLDKVYQTFGIAPVQGGPLYIWKNLSHSVSSGPANSRGGSFLKYRRVGSGTTDWGGGRLYVFNNTALRPRSGEGSPPSVFLHTFNEVNRLRSVRTLNNIMLVSGVRSLGSFSSEDSAFDYDLILGDSNFPLGDESHAVTQEPVFVPDWGLDPATRRGFFALEANSPGRDAGTAIPNFLTRWTGSAPDMGAHESFAGLLEFGVNAGLPTPVGPLP